MWKEIIETCPMGIDVDILGKHFRMIKIFSEPLVYRGSGKINDEDIRIDLDLSANLAKVSTGVSDQEYFSMCEYVDLDKVDVSVTNLLKRIKKIRKIDKKYDPGIWEIVYIGRDKYCYTKQVLALKDNGRFYLKGLTSGSLFYLDRLPLTAFHEIKSVKVLVKIDEGSVIFPNVSKEN